MEEYKIYSKEACNSIQKALPIVRALAQQYLETQSANQSTKDSMYLAMNKQKRFDRLQTNTQIESSSQNQNSTSQNKIRNDNDESSSASFIEYDYSSSDEDTKKEETQTTNATIALSNMSLSNQQQPTPQKSKAKSKQKKSASDKINLGTPPLCTLPLQNPSDVSDIIQIMELPFALLSSTSSPSIISNLPSTCEEYLELAQNTITNQPIILLLLRSGRFAGAIFQGDKCISHRVCTQYTVRRGQGGAQSSSDNRKKAKSMGAQLRRAGEEKLKNDVTSFLNENEKHIKNAALILQSCPKTMQSILTQNDFYAKAKHGDKVRKIPLSVGRPTYEMACQVHSTLMTVSVRNVSMEEYQSRMGLLTKENIDDNEAYHQASNENGQNLSQQDPNVKVQQTPSTKESPPKPVIVPLTPLHKAAASGNLDDVTRHAQTYLSNNQNDNDPYHDHIDINIRAGEKQMTALHFAASSNSPQASECIIYLLQTCHANPCCLDSHNRPPYYLASSDKIREAFRLSRSQLGEDYCKWDSIAKVGPALSLEDIQNKKQKLAEKKKRQRQRQKEKKAKARIEKQEAEEQKKKEEEQKQKEMDAKRSRAGLAPKKLSSNSNACDYCGKTGMKRSQMFSRLDFIYCSMDCVKKHQRELSANAALARFGGS